jgi:hypothetical protein
MTTKLTGISGKTVEAKARSHAPHSKAMRRERQLGQGGRGVSLLGARFLVRHRESRSGETGVEHSTTSVYDDCAERKL